MFIAIGIVTILGGIFGLGLAFAERKFHVQVDSRLEEIYQRLPQANCGACGMPGCMGFASALLAGKTTLERCSVINLHLRGEIAAILGIRLETAVRKIAVLHCHGGNLRAKDKFLYNGLGDCISANLIQGGPKRCWYGCIGYGSCAVACPFGAITMSKEGLPVVDEDKCTGCGKCVEVCPKKLFSLVTIDKQYAVRCKSQDSGKEVLASCQVGCIGCGKCQRACPNGAIQVVNNLAIIDYSLCRNNGSCFTVCPTKAIAKKQDKIWQTRK